MRFSMVGIAVRCCRVKRTLLCLSYVVTKQEREYNKMKINLILERIQKHMLKI